MPSSRCRPWRVPLFGGKSAMLRLRRGPELLHLEVTMRCNATMIAFPAPKLHA